MDADEQVLSRVPLFASLPKAEIRFLDSSLTKTALMPGVELFHEGEAGNVFYVLIEGEIEVIKAKGTPEEQVISIRKSGEFIGELSLLNPNGLRTATVVARTPVRLLEMKRADFDALLTRQPMLAYRMAHELSLRLSESHDLAIRDFQKKNQELSQAYAALQTAQAQIIEKEKLERELQVARRIQMSILPVTLPQLTGFDFGARLLPARAVGGDTYDFIPLDPDQVGIVIGDVTDKGVPAAIFMAQTRALIRAEASRSVAPGKTLQRVNHLLMGMNAESLFATVLYGVLDRQSRMFRYARAGHESPLLCEPDCSVSQLPHGPGQPLGLFSSPLVDEQEVLLSSGRTLFLYTDGAADLLDPNGKDYGLERLTARLGALAGLPADDLVDRLLADLTAFRSSAPQADDITLVALRADPDVISEI